MKNTKTGAVYSGAHQVLEYVATDDAVYEVYTTGWGRRVAFNCHPPCVAEDLARHMNARFRFRPGPWPLVRAG